MICFWLKAQEVKCFHTEFINLTLLIECVPPLQNFSAEMSGERNYPLTYRKKIGVNFRGEREFHYNFVGMHNQGARSLCKKDRSKCTYPLMYSGQKQGGFLTPLS